MEVRRTEPNAGQPRDLSSLRYVRRSTAVTALSPEDNPKLRRPILIAAFEGWNDAGESASYAASYLAGAWDATTFAEIDPDEFFDFTEVRPEVTLTDSGDRTIVWPSTTFSIVRGEDDGPDVVIVRGPEPHLRWQAYSSAVVELAEFLGVEQVITLGAYLGEVTHGRQVPVSASSSDPRVADRHGLSPSLYEGPTGIVGVLAAALAAADIPAVSVWASVPCYSLPVSPKAALALVHVASRLVGREANTEELECESADYEQRMDELVAEDENVAAYVERIEEMEQVIGSELSAEGLAEEIERYLRNNRSG